MNKKVIISIIAVIALVAILGTVLVACNADSYKKKLENKGYSVGTYKADSDEEDDIEWGVVAYKDNVLVPDVTIIKYKSLDDAKEAETDAKALKNRGLIGAVYRSGKIVIVGTEQGVKDAK